MPVVHGRRMIRKPRPTRHNRLSRADDRCECEWEGDEFEIDCRSGKEVRRRRDVAYEQRDHVVVVASRIVVVRGGFALSRIGGRRRFGRARTVCEREAHPLPGLFVHDVVVASDQGEHDVCVRLRCQHRAANEDPDYRTH